MRTSFLAVLLLVVLPAVSLICQTGGFPKPPVLFQSPLSPRIANYDMAVTLEPEQRMLRGRQVISWRNDSPNPVSDLRLHLYLNAFRNNRSTFMLESGGRHRGNEIDEEGWGFIEVLEMRLVRPDLRSTQLSLNRLPEMTGVVELPGPDLSGDISYIQPDTPDHSHDKTMMRVPLPEPVQPGETINLYTRFVARLPEPPFARTGAKDEFFFVGQWFPKMAVLEENGWNTHQFHLNSEFFADYGVYNVFMTVPRENKLGATGMQVGDIRDNGDGTATHFYHAEDVHDFAWTTSPEFQEHLAKAQDVEIRLLLQPDHRDQAARHLEAAKKSVEYFQNWYGDYPYPNLTVVDPRREADGAGGMEYPTLITAGTFYGMPEGFRPLEIVILHEFGHNYWYGLLASNEFEESWLDEGINSYTEVQIMNDWFGPKGDMLDMFGLQVNDIEFQRAAYLSTKDYDPVVQDAWGFYNNRSYGINSYMRPATLLSSLQNYLGRERMQAAMRAYVERFRFKHPTTRDFINTFNDVTGENLDWFFDQALFSTAVLDYAVDGVFTRKWARDEGFDFTVDVESLIDTLAFATDSAATADSSETIYYSGVNLRRRGDFKVPVEVRITFEDGEVIQESWDGQSLWKKFRYHKPSKLVSAELDPDNKWLLDANIANNSKAVEPHKSGVTKISGRYTFWVQFLQDMPEVFNLLFLFQ